MALPSSGKISLDDIKDEYVDCKPDPVSMSEFYNGGTYVGSTGGVGVPSSGEISFSDFHGKSGTWAGSDGLDRYYHGCYNVLRLGSSSRSTSWTGTVTHVFTATFSDMAGYFASLSEVVLTASLAPDTTNDQNTSMKNLLASVNARFEKTDYDATSTTDRVFYTKSGTGTYSSDKYEAKARISGSTIIFTVSITETSDGVVNQPITGTTTSVADVYNHVDEATPSYTLNSGL